MQQSDSRSTFVILVAETRWFLGRCSLFETNRRSTRNLWLSYALLLTINKEKNILKGSTPVTSSRESLGLKTVPFLFLRLSSFGWVVVFGSFFKLIATLLRLLSREGNFAELNLHLSVLRTCRSFLSYPFSFFLHNNKKGRELPRGASLCQRDENVSNRTNQFFLDHSRYLEHRNWHCDDWTNSHEGNFQIKNFSKYGSAIYFAILMGEYIVDQLVIIRIS